MKSLSLKSLYYPKIKFKKPKIDKEDLDKSEKKDKTYKNKLKLNNLYLGEKTNRENTPEYVPLTPQDQKLMDAMENAIEKEISNSVSSLAENKKNLKNQKLLGERMGFAAKGFEYENTVINALMAAKAAGNILKGAGSSSKSSDADINIFGKIFNVEIKLNPYAQMGGSSIRYNKDGEINLVDNLEEDTEELLLSAVKSKDQEINRLLDFLVEQDPKNINSRAVKFPLTCTKDAWVKAQQSKLLINARIPLTARFIANHYAKKGIYYIQIGNAGLFYLKDNPANLPIPKLQGNIIVEIRTARAGSRPLSNGIRVVSAGIRVQGKLKTKNKSPYTIDDPESIRSMLNTLKQNKHGYAESISVVTLPPPIIIEEQQNKIDTVKAEQSTTNYAHRDELSPWWADLNI